MTARVQENELALDCIQKALDKEHGGRVFIVRDDSDTMAAVRNSVVPIPVAVIASTTRTPQRKLRHVVVTSESEREIPSGDVEVAAGCVDAADCMKQFLGKATPVQEPDIHVAPVTVEQPAVVPTPLEKPVVNRLPKRTAISLIEELLQ